MKKSKRGKKKSNQKGGETKMKRLPILALAILLVAGIYGVAGAAQLDLTVPCQYLSVSITHPPVGFGTVLAGDTEVISSSATVTNDGTATADYEIQCSSAIGVANWGPTGSADPAANNEFRLCVLFNGDTEPADTDFDTNNDYLTLAGRTSTATVFAGTEDGDDVGTSSVLGLWFRLDAPTGIPDSDEHTITVTVTAAAN